MSSHLSRAPLRRSVRRLAKGGLATRETRRAETHFLDAEAVAHLGSWELDLATGTLTVSHEMRRVLGWAWEGEPDLAQICDAAHPDDRTRVEDWIGRDPASAPRTAGCFFRLVRPDGTLGTFFGRRAYRLGHNGKPARICGTIQDVTEQVATERAINEAAHLYRDIFENCAWGLFQTTADGRYLTANPALARIYGYASPAELLNKLTDIGGQLYVDPKRRDAFVDLMKQHGMVQGFEAQVYRRDGSMIWISETCREVRTSTGRLLYYEGTVEDISERKRNEAAVLRATAEAETAKRAVEAANQELERRVAERTAELRTTQDELLRKERLSTLGRLTATVAHELRNPLSAIRNSMHVLREVSDDDDLRYQRPLGRIERCVTRCDHIISDLIDYSHARKLTRRNVRLDEWLGAFLDGHDVGADVALEPSLNAPGALVQLDGERFRRAIVNVIENAVQAFVEHGDLTERRITVATEAGDRARIVIADTGPGIAPDILPKVFDPLFSTKSFGTGLGLPTVKQIVEQHDGTVEIDSAPGQGTRITIALPLAA